VDARRFGFPMSFVELSTFAVDAMPADRSEVGSLEGGVVSTATASSAA
jgi:hypothetical protein